MAPTSNRQKRVFNLRVRLRQNVDATEEPSTSSGIGTSSSDGGSGSRSKNWRANLQRSDPTRYRKLLDHAKDYSQYYRLRCATAANQLEKRTLSSEETEEATKWHQRKLKMNEGSRKRVQRMNERKKQQEQVAKTRKKKCSTRQQSDKKKEKERIRKQIQRARKTPAQKKAILALRRQKYKQKRMSEEEKRLQKERDALRKEEERLKKLEEDLLQQKLTAQQESQALQHDNAALEGPVDLRTDMAKAKALERVRKALPKRRSHSVTTTLDIIRKATPVKAKAFRRASMSPSSALEDGIVEAVAEGLQQDRRSAKRKALASSLSSLRGLKRAMSRRFSISRKLLKNAVKKSAGRKPIPPATVQMIQDFYESNSSPLPEKKFVSKKTLKPRHIMEKTIAQLHQKYNEAHPDHRVCSAVFYRHRPRYVKHRAQAGLSSCLCEYCENIQLKLDSMRHYNMCRDGYDLVNTTLCPKQPGSKYHQLKCITRDCQDCGVDLLDEKMAAVLEIPEKMFQWKVWQMVSSECHSKDGTKTVKKRSLIEKSGTATELVAELKTEAVPFAEHLFNKDWQQQQQSLLRGKLQANEVLGIYDFSENFKCAYQREVQSAYYAKESVTIHPIVTYYLCHCCGSHVTESCVMISDDLLHDYHLVNTFQQTVTEHLRGTRSLDIKTFYRFSDGCSSQYKSRGPISDIAHAETDFQMELHHNYSGTRHGKGASDGESGVVKKHASEAVRAGIAIIKDASSLHKYLSKNMTKDAEEDQCCTAFRRTMFYIPSTSVNRARGDRALMTVPGTRRLHSIKTKEHGIVMVRNLSCFCDGCLRGPGRCDNADYVNEWKDVNLQQTRRTGTGTSKSRRYAGPAGGDSGVDVVQQDPADPGRDTTDEANNAEGGPRGGGCNEVATSDLETGDQSDAGMVDSSNPSTSSCVITSQTYVSSSDNVKDGNGDNCHQTPAPTSCDKGRQAIDSAKVKVNMHVAVKFKPSKKGALPFAYIAMVTRVDGRGLQLKFMRMRNTDGFVFTDEPEALHPVEDIVRLLTDPQMVKTGRALVYKFDERELEEMAHEFILK